MSGELLLCVCEEEWCFCSNVIHVDDYDPRNTHWPPPEIACDECKKGNHVMEVAAKNLVVRK